MHTIKTRQTGMVTLFVAALTAAPAVFADHASPWGAGWANMPNDIHNTRLDTLGDTATFTDFVRYGDGADSVNRYLDDDLVTRGGVMGGAGAGMLDTVDTSRGTGRR